MQRLRVEGGRTYLGRSATGLEFETERREIVSDQVAEVSRGRSSCASSEGPNGPRKGIKGGMSTQRNSTTDKRQKSQYRLAFPEESRGAAPTAFEDRIGVGEAQSRKSDYRAVDGRSLRAGKLHAGVTTSEGQQR